VTVSPCEVCSRLLIAAGIARVVWHAEYRDTAGLDILAEANVELL
jgi:deoxycytidylate deaminase